MEENDAVLCGHYAKMLGLTEDWKVSGVDLSVSEKRLELEVKWEQSGAVCPECGQECSRYDVAEERRWRHLDAMGFETVIRARVPRANCLEHGVLQMRVPWAGVHSRFTLAFEAFAIKVLLASRSVKAACELLGLSWQAAHQIMERAVERGLDARVLEGLRIVGMDEKSFLSGQSYASLLYEVDPENSRVLEVMMDRDGDAAELLWETLPQEVREAIEAVCLDMSGIYREVAADLVPQAKIVHDKFHVSKHLNEAVDKVRRRENNALQAEGDDRLKGARQLFLFNPENLPKDRVADFEALKNSDLKAARAWAIKESFRTFWQCKTLKEAQGVFKKWYAWAIRCRLHEIKKVARMLKRHLDGLLNFVLFPITNAVAEGFNSKIQSLKADARGFRNFLNYRIRILFFCGRLNLLPSL
jgi:transposase